MPCTFALFNRTESENFFLLLFILFIYILNIFPLPSFPSTNPLCHPHPPASMRVYPDYLFATSSVGFSL